MMNITNSEYSSGFHYAYDAMNMTETYLPATVASTYDECNPLYLNCRVQKWLYYIFAPILFLLSITGCLLAIAVMRTKSFSERATSVFVISLAVADATAVVTGTLRHFILKAVSIDVRKLSAASCQIHRFTLYAALNSSAWILIAISLERLIAVCFPDKRHWLTSKRKAFLVVMGIVLLQSLLSVDVFFTRGTEISKTGSIKTCGYTSSAAKSYWTNTRAYIAMTNYCFIPFVVMLSCNITIILRLRKLNSRLPSKRKAAAKVTSMTKMLLTVTFYFIIFTIPSFIFTQYQEQIFKHSTITEEAYAYSELWDALLTLLMYINHSINFILYCIAGKRFRSEFMVLVRRCFTNKSLMSTDGYTITYEMTKTQRQQHSRSDST